LPFDFGAILVRTDPTAPRKPLRYRRRDELPYDIEAVPADLPLLLDTTVYMDQFQGRLRVALADLVTSRDVRHAAPALSELALTFGHLDPTDARTAAAVHPLRELLETISPARIVSPDETMWVEGAVLSGMLARTQQIPKADRRKFLNDTLLYLLAERTGATLVTRNSRDFDLLLQIRPGPSVLFYDRT
jgi:hypothetical protein